MAGGEPAVARIEAARWRAAHRAHCRRSNHPEGQTALCILTPRVWHAAPIGAREDVEAARFLLYHEQARWAEGLADLSGTDPRTLALERAAARMDPSLRDGDYVYDGAFRYPLRTEELRWTRTRAIIDRVGPGPDEDGGYFELLARQAAAVELVLLGMAEAEDKGLDFPIGPALDAILLGTTGEPRSNATTSRLQNSSAASIALSAGMVYLMYQASKAVVLSWEPKPVPEGHTAAFAIAPEDVVAVLDADSRPVDQLASTFIAWLLTGVARAADSRAPDPMYHPPLALLINNSERWVIAHEYCHALFDGPPRPRPRWLPQPTTPYEKEFRADLFATVVLIAAGDMLDGMAPNMVLQGAALAMKVHEIADRVIHLGRGGTGDPLWASTSHPPFDERATAVFAAYADVVGAAIRDLPLEPAYAVALTLDELWRRARTKIVSALGAHPRLHPLWSQ